MFLPGEVIDLDDVLPVGRVSEFELQHFGVVARLLDGIGGRLVGGLGFDDGQVEVAGIAQQVVHALGRLPDEALANRHDPPISDGALLRDPMRLVVPARFLEQGHNEFAAGICFGQH